VAGVAYQAMTAEVPGKDALAGFNRLLLAHVVEAHPPPGRLRAFDDEGRRVGIELVGVRPDPAMLGFLEDEREGVVELLVRAEPNVLGLANVDVRPEGISERAAHFRIRTISCHDEIAVSVCIDAVSLGFEANLHPKAASAILQDIEQTPAADAAEAVPLRACDGTAVEHRDVVPIAEGPLDRFGALGIAALQVGKRLIGQHHAPAEGVIRAVALDNHDVVARIAQLRGDGEIEPGRPSTETGNAHGLASVIATGRRELALARAIFQA
jgi:hypothetical protein